ncbi:vitamin K epoxide reductase family protein [bacterium]|nr:MAG: vitamin K epoxide reductase family protein [bacterium]
MGRKHKRTKSSQEKTPVQGKQAGGKKKKRQPVPRRREHPNWPLTALAGTGMVLTAYLSLTSWLGQHPLFCEGGSTCDIVQQSRWGTFLMLPTAFWGFLTYATLAYIGFRVRNPGRHWKTAWAVSLAGLSYSVYLNTISLFVIEAACIYCLASLLIMAVIFGLVFFQRPTGLPDFNFKVWAGEMIVLTVVIIGGMHLHYSGVFVPSAGPEDHFLRGLAEHLSENKDIIYGAYW